MLGKFLNRKKKGEEKTQEDIKNNAKKELTIYAAFFGFLILMLVIGNLFGDKSENNNNNNNNNSNNVDSKIDYKSFLNKIENNYDLFLTIVKENDTLELSIRRHEKNEIIISSSATYLKIDKKYYQFDNGYKEVNDPKLYDKYNPEYLNINKIKTLLNYLYDTKETIEEGKYKLSGKIKLTDIIREYNLGHLTNFKADESEFTEVTIYYDEEIINKISIDFTKVLSLIEEKTYSKYTYSYEFMNTGTIDLTEVVSKIK